HHLSSPRPGRGTPQEPQRSEALSRAQRHGACNPPCARTVAGDSALRGCKAKTETSLNPWPQTNRASNVYGVSVMSSNMWMYVKGLVGRQFVNDGSEVYA